VSRDNPLRGESDGPQFSGFDTRLPLGVGVLGKIVQTGQEVVFKDLQDAPPELFPAEWVAREKVRGFTATPISFKGEVLGVIAAYVRVSKADETHPWRHVLGDHIGAAIANARAFEEIQRLKAQLEIQNAYLKEEVIEANAFGELVGQSEALRHIVSQIDLVAPTEASVLILGESGTGKELVAREIHNRSRRKDKPLIRVNCASVPKDLYESEFFGHARGSFTGASGDKQGPIEAANHGTLFLDEIGELALDLQPQLLRVLDRRSVRRVGETHAIDVDLRVIAATHRDLRAMVRAGQFREDLYYRLAVVATHVPPLRERKADIPALAAWFAERMGRGTFVQSPSLIELLERHDWPGNVRELRNVVERALSLGDAALADLADAGDRGPAGTTAGDDAPGRRAPTAGGAAAPDMRELPFSPRRSSSVTAPASRSRAASRGDTRDPFGDLPEGFKEAKAALVESFERDYLSALLARHRGNISRAAAEAGIDRNYIHRLVKKYGLEVDRG
jgi:transcriptional regulator with GAF, ATPase, and Fis domain